MNEWNNAIEAAAKVCDEYWRAGGMYLAVRIRALAAERVAGEDEVDRLRKVLADTAIWITEAYGSLRSDRPPGPPTAIISMIEAALALSPGKVEEADMHCQWCGQWHSSVLGSGGCPPKPGASSPGKVEGWREGNPWVIDNDKDEITVTFGGKELRGWSYADDNERRQKMLQAREYVEGWYDGREAHG